MKVGVFTDSHFCSAEIACVTRRPSLSLEKIKEAMRVFASEGVEAVICLGDLIDCFDTPPVIKENLHHMHRLIASYGIEFHCVPGNHDCLVMSKKEFAGILHVPELPYSIQKNQTELVFLDACFRRDGVSYDADEFSWTDSMIPSDQIDFLDTTLQNSRAEHIYIFTHQCLDPSAEHNHRIANASEVQKILSSCKKVRAVFSGHYHFGGIQIFDAIAYITLEAMCEGERNFFKIFDL